MLLLLKVMLDLILNEVVLITFKTDGNKLRELCFKTSGQIDLNIFC